MVLRPCLTGLWGKFQEFGAKYIKEALRGSKRSLMDYFVGIVGDLNDDRDADFKVQV